MSDTELSDSEQRKRESHLVLLALEISSVTPFSKFSLINYYRELIVAHSDLCVFLV